MLLVFGLVRLLPPIRAFFVIFRIPVGRLLRLGITAGIGSVDQSPKAIERIEDTTADSTGLDLALLRPDTERSFGDGEHDGGLFRGNGKTLGCCRDGPGSRNDYRRHGVPFLFAMFGIEVIWTAFACNTRH